MCNRNSGPGWGMMTHTDEVETGEQGTLVHVVGALKENT